MTFHEILIPVIGVAVPFLILFLGRRVQTTDKKATQMQDVVDFITANKERIARLEKEQEQMQHDIRDNENKISRLEGRLNGRD